MGTIGVYIGLDIGDGRLVDERKVEYFQPSQIGWRKLWRSVQNPMGSEEVRCITCSLLY